MGQFRTIGTVVAAVAGGLLGSQGDHLPGVVRVAAGVVLAVLSALGIPAVPPITRRTADHDQAVT